LPFAELKDGNKMWYVEKGSGAPVVFVHDWLCSSQTFSKQIDQFGQWQHAIAFDLLGHGKSDKPDSDSYSIPQLAAALDSAVTKVIGKEKFILVGHSLGGSLGLDYATTPSLASRLRALVLLNTAPSPKSEALAEYSEKLGKSEFDLKDRSLIEKTIASNYFGDKFAREHRDAVNNFIDLVTTNDRQALRRALDGLLKVDHESQLKAINVPTLILAGDKDTLIPPENSKLMNKKIKRSDLRIFGPGIGHMSQIEAEDQFRNLVGAFLLTVK
jgi:pimeloyl-ACP methyl ester carboxylesterase